MKNTKGAKGVLNKAEFAPTWGHLMILGCYGIIKIRT